MSGVDCASQRGSTGSLHLSRDLRLPETGAATKVTIYAAGEVKGKKCCYHHDKHESKNDEGEFVK